MTVYLKDATGKVLDTIEDARSWNAYSVMLIEHGYRVFRGCDAEAGQYYTDRLSEEPEANTDVDEALDIVQGVNTDGADE